MAFGKIIQQCIPLVRFFLISSADFYHYVKPFACILPDTLYEDLLHHYLVPGSETAKVSRYPPRSPSFPPWGSHIIRTDHMMQITAWIKDQDPSFMAAKPRFNLLFRGSRDGFTPEDFHRLCDNKGPTVTIIKVKGNGKLIGGYSPVSWHSRNWGEETRTFLLSLGDRQNTEFILSKFILGNAVGCYSHLGPLFGPSYGEWWDLALCETNFQTSADSYCKKSQSYSHGLLHPTRHVKFSVDDYEVFQVFQN